MTEFIEYDALVQNGLRTVVRQALEIAQQGMPSGHHFYLTFRTAYPGVDIPPHLKSSYPDEMSILLENEFWDLNVSEKEFSVMLMFDTVARTIVVPFEAISAFSDPYANFGLKLEVQEIRNEINKKTSLKDNKTSDLSDKKASEDNQNVSKIISLDQFRKR